jgi:hypothetical protein
MAREPPAGQETVGKSVDDYRPNNLAAPCHWVVLGLGLPFPLEREAIASSSMIPHIRFLAPYSF